MPPHDRIALRVNSFLPIAAPNQVRIFWILVILMTLTAAASGWVSSPVSESGYNGICLQFAGNLDKAQKILRAWGESNQRRVMSSIRLDFAFIVFYVGTLVVGSQIAGDAFASGGRMQLAKGGGLLARAAIAAGTFDVIENCGLLQLLSGHLNRAWPPVIMVCASLKFILSIAGAVYLIAAMAIFRSRFFR